MIMDMLGRRRSSLPPGRIPRPRALAAALPVLIALIWLHSAAPASATAGVPLPAEFGSEWVVVAGYNTFSHTGHDPDALDIVRVDGQTAGSLVLAPVGGRVRYAGSDCVSIEDASSLSHLLCHFWPLPGLERGTEVVAGQILGEVAPDGFAGNNGIAHIHYAVHRDGQGETVPFSGAYALEGVELRNSGQWNEHATRAFVSSNRLAGAATPTPTPSPEAPPAADPGPSPQEPVPQEDESPAAESGSPTVLPGPDPFDPNRLQPGWNLVAWLGDGSVRDGIRGIDSAVESVLAFDAGTQRYRAYSPFLPAAANSLDAVEPGQAVWLSVTAGTALDWQRSGRLIPGSLRLRGGFNLVAWAGETRDIVTAIEPIARWVVSVHAWDADDQRYRVYRPGAPAFLNDLHHLRTGEGVWVEIKPRVLD